jgi:hypothetical protein
MDVKKLTENLSHWWWTPKHPKHYVDHWQGRDGREAAINLFWALSGSPARFDFEKHLGLWVFTSNVVLERANAHRIEDYILTMRPRQFHDEIVHKMPNTFSEVPNIRRLLYTAEEVKNHGGIT